MMDLEVVKFIFTVIQTLAMAWVTFYVYISNKDKVTNARISKLETDIDTRMDGQSERIARLEEQVKGGPTHDDLGKLYEKLNRVAESNSRVEGELKAVADTLRMILNKIAEKGMQ